MKKRIIAICCLGFIVFTLNGCFLKDAGDINNVINNLITDNEDTDTTTESMQISGVPESVVLRNIDIPENATYDITHNYDADSHIDDVVITTRYSGEYGTQTAIYNYAYQYDRSTDLWSLIGGNNGKQSDVIELRRESFIREAPFSGDFKQAHSGSYRIRFKDIDFANKLATIEYLIVFDDGSPMLSSTQTFALYTTTDGENLCFVIPYKRSMVVMFELVFILDMNEGLRA